MNDGSLTQNKSLVRWFGATVSAIGFLSLFQENLDLGVMLGGVIAVYNQLRDFLFAPLDFFGFTLPESTKSFLLFLSILTSAFLLRGGKSNQVAAICILASIAWVIFVFLGLFVLGAIGMGAIFNEVDTKGYENTSFFVKVLYPMFLISAMPVMMSLMFPEVWFFMILFPFLGVVLRRVPLFGWIWDIVLLQTKMTFDILSSIFNIKIEGDPVAEVNKFSEWWGWERYCAYYRPLADALLVAGVLAFFGKVVFDTFL